jgi:hypothetical protein
MRPSFSLFLAALVISSAPAFAATDTAANHAGATPAAQNASSSPDKKYCIASDETTTGTKIVTRECRTKADWAKRGVDIDELKKQQ